FTPVCLACYRMGTRASRNPWTGRGGELVDTGLKAARQTRPEPSRLPPRPTRFGPLCVASVHHCHTLPCMSHNPNLFGGYAPTRVGRARCLPCGAWPNGKLPLKFACSEDRSLVGLAK